MSSPVGSNRLDFRRTRLHLQGEPSSQGRLTWPMKRPWVVRAVTRCWRRWSAASIFENGVGPITPPGIAARKQLRRRVSSSRRPSCGPADSVAHPGHGHRGPDPAMGVRAGVASYPNASLPQSCSSLQRGAHKRAPAAWSRCFAGACAFLIQDGADLEAGYHSVAPTRILRAFFAAWAAGLGIQALRQRAELPSGSPGNCSGTRGEGASGGGRGAHPLAASARRSRA